MSLLIASGGDARIYSSHATDRDGEHRRARKKSADRSPTAPGNALRLPI